DVVNIDSPAPGYLRLRCGASPRDGGQQCSQVGDPGRGHWCYSVTAGLVRSTTWTVTAAPSDIFSIPPTTTWSPASTPSSTSTNPGERTPSVTGRRVALSSLMTHTTA